MSQEQPVDPVRIVPQGFVFPGTESLDPREVFAGPGYQAPRQHTDPVAVVALVTTVLSPFPGFGAIAALTGWWALRRLRRSYATGHAQARLGIVVGSATTVGWLWICMMSTF
ncbi:MAG: imidazolonepropionase [Actinomyces sp.]|nr:MAG: imidazolonepropionase [Actinomyces sp.]